MNGFAVYVIRCTTNGKCYVGKTGRPRFRWYMHRCLAKKGAGKRIGESALYRAMRKYGADSFVFEISAESRQKQAETMRAIWAKRRAERAARDS